MCAQSPHMQPQNLCTPYSVLRLTQGIQYFHTVYHNDSLVCCGFIFASLLEQSRLPIILLVFVSLMVACLLGVFAGLM